MKKALTLCGLKEWFSIDDTGHLIPDGPGNPDEMPDPFSRRIPEGADRRETMALREKEKGRLARRLAGAGFSQSAVYSVLRELEQVFRSGGSEEQAFSVHHNTISSSRSNRSTCSDTD